MTTGRVAKAVTMHVVEQPVAESSPPPGQPPHPSIPISSMSADRDIIISIVLDWTADRLKPTAIRTASRVENKKWRRLSFIKETALQQV
jgi:hypothetical protein